MIIDIDNSYNILKEGSMPKISVIVPIFNVEQYLEECLKSICQQSFRDIEILCINDGSTDGSLAVLEKMKELDKRIIVVSKSNSGYGNSVNVGLDMAKGEYICIVESDDFIDSDMFSVYYDSMERNSLDVLKTDSRSFVNEDGYSFTKRSVVQNRDLYNIIFSQKDYTEKFSGYVYTWAGMYRRSFLNEYSIRHNESPGASYQDNGFWFQTSMYARRLMFLNRAFYNLRRDNPNSSFYNKDKVFAISDEYDFIHTKIEESHLANKGELFRLCFLYRYRNSIWTIKRVNPEHIESLYPRLQTDFIKAMDNGEIDARYFSEIEWKNIFHIICGDKIEEANITIATCTMKKILSCESIYIYGAGVYARRLYASLEELGTENKVKGFITTKQEKETELFHLPILNKSEYDWKDGNLVILAMNRALGVAVWKTLEKEGKHVDLFFLTNEISERCK